MRGASKLPTFAATRLDSRRKFGQNSVFGAPITTRAGRQRETGFFFAIRATQKIPKVERESKWKVKYF